MASLATVAHDPDRAEKRPGAFRTIGEVAEELGLPQHVLRFWEARFVQLRPTKRAGGRRYYRPEDVDLIKGIRRLLHGQGYTIRGAQRVLKESGVRFVQAIGRGEAEAGAPPLAERQEPGADGPDGHPRENGETLADGSAANEVVLRDLLRDLQACRDTLAGLRIREMAPEDREGLSRAQHAGPASLSD